MRACHPSRSTPCCRRARCAASAAESDEATEAPPAAAFAADVLPIDAAGEPAATVLVLLDGHLRRTPADVLALACRGRTVALPEDLGDAASMDGCEPLGALAGWRDRPV